MKENPKPQILNERGMRKGDKITRPPVSERERSPAHYNADYNTPGRGSHQSNFACFLRQMAYLGAGRRAEGVEAGTKSRLPTSGIAGKIFDNRGLTAPSSGIKLDTRYSSQVAREEVGVNGIPAEVQSFLLPSSQTNDEKHRLGRAGVFRFQVLIFAVRPSVFRQVPFQRIHNVLREGVQGV